MKKIFYLILVLVFTANVYGARISIEDSKNQGGQNYTFGDAFIDIDTMTSEIYLVVDNEHVLDLVDGTLSGSKVGTGINASNITTGTLLEAYVDSTIARDSELHDSVTIGTASGLSLSTQVLSLALADNTNPGAISAAWIVFLESIDTEAEFKALYNLEIGTDIQGYSSVLSTYAGIDPSANVQTLLGAADYAAIRTLLSVYTESDVDILLTGKQDTLTTSSDLDVNSVTTVTLDVAGTDGSRTIVINCNTYATGFTPAAGETGLACVEDSGGTPVLYYYEDGGSLTEIGTGGGSLSITEQSSDPTYSGMSTGDLIVSTSSGDMFYKSATGGYAFTGAYTIDATYPTITAATVNGTAWVITASEVLTAGAGGNGGFVGTGSATGSITLTYNSGDGTDTLNYTGSPTAVFGETITLAYTQPGNGWEDSTGDDLQTFSGVSVTNNTPGSNPTYQWDLEDNTTGTTVTATYGGTAATLYGASNTSDVYDATTSCDSTGSFQMPSASCIILPDLSGVIQDGVFTIEFTINGDGVGFGTANPRLLRSGTNLINIIYASDTSVSIYINGSNLGTATIDDINDAQCQYIRLVCAQGSDASGTGDDIALYQKTGAGSWGLKWSAATFTSPATATVIEVYGQQNGANYIGSDTDRVNGGTIKVWDSVAIP